MLVFLRQTTPRVAAALLTVALFLAGGMLAAFAGCQAFGGRPGGDGEATIADTGNAPCLGTCAPDPGWRPVDCKAAGGIDTLRVVNFDDPGNTTDNVAANLYSYTDGTAGRLLFAYTSFGLDGIGYSDAGWQPPTLTMPPGSVVPSDAGLCETNNKVLHVLGGPFRGWGGGMGVALQKLNGRALYRSDTTGDSRRNLCVGSEPPDYCPPASGEYAVSVAALDVSQFDGVSFWARRGPDGQTGLRLNIGDKYTDDDLSYLAYRYSRGSGKPICDGTQSSADCVPLYCKRIRECSCRSKEQVCTYYATAPVPGDPPGFYCGATPEEVRQLIESSSGSGAQGGGSVDNRFCNVTACDRPYPAFATTDDNLSPDGGVITAPDGGRSLGDPQFFGRACTPYDWPNGISTAYCFDPGKDPPPSPDTGICGDHWMKTVTLSTEWQFFKVPFTDLRQQGYGQRSPKLDLTSVSMVRFSWDVGFVDYWLDDVSFYRWRP